MLVRFGEQVQEVSRSLTGDRIRGTIVRLGIAGVVAITTVASYATYRILDQGQRDDRSSTDAIVVMGAAQYDGTPSPIFAARLDHAVALFRDGVAPRLIVTGGKAAGDRTTEAASARAYAIAHGVPDDAILGEDRSRTTLASIRAVAALMREADIERAVFVSDRSHMLRVLQMATDAGIEATGSPTGTSPLEGDLVATADAVIHELGALAVYVATGGSR